MEVELDKVLTVVRDFIAHKQGAAARPIDADTPLLRDGHIDSFGLVELISELQSKLNVAIPDGSLIPEDFETPRVLFDRLRDL
jgi:acyl carrier protein